MGIEARRPPMQQINDPFDRRSWTMLRPVTRARSQTWGYGQGVVQVADLSINPEWHEVIRGGRRIQLTRLEFRLLYLLAVNSECVVPYEALVQQAWGFPAESSDSALLKSPICRLRAKVRLRRPSRLTIESVARTGYRLASNG